MRPALKYNGAKWLLADWIIRHFPEHASYVEPFGGSAAVLIRKPRSRFEYYNDLDGSVVNFFRQLQKNPISLVRQIKWTPYSREVFEQAKTGNQTDGIEGALNFYICNQMNRSMSGKPGTFRLRGNIGATDGRYNPAGLFAQTAHLFEIAERLRGVHFENRDGLQVIRDLDHEDTLVFADPHYLNASSGLYRQSMHTEAQHVALAETLKSARSKIVLSGYDSDLYGRLYEGWLKIETETRDNARNKRIECLWFNRAAQFRDLFSEARA
jgi:DNA adenine methylase